ncbi:50S ribosomal protein L22 [Candidatus Fermentibacterales bacterium]|nr:50S ribosomal protein L22 [Candidatus Fermentibacterales bacterium]
MEAVARARYVRVPPRKARQVADLIRGKTVNQALSVLLTTPRKAAKILEKTLDSAVSNAIVLAEGAKLDPDTLVVSDIAVDQGPVILRWRPRARGRATRIRHRTSHITIRVASPDELSKGGEE